jgi:hypothetical protein
LWAWPVSLRRVPAALRVYEERVLCELFADDRFELEGGQLEELVGLLAEQGDPEPLSMC